MMSLDPGGLISSCPALRQHSTQLPGPNLPDLNCLLQGYLETSIWRPPKLQWVCEFDAALHRASLDVTPQPSSYAHSSMRRSVDWSSWLRVRQFRADSLPETSSLVNPHLSPRTILPKKSYNIPLPVFFPYHSPLFPILFSNSLKVPQGLHHWAWQHLKQLHSEEQPQLKIFQLSSLDALLYLHCLTKMMKELKEHHYRKRGGKGRFHLLLFSFQAINLLGLGFLSNFCLCSSNSQGRSFRNNNRKVVLMQGSLLSYWHLQGLTRLYKPASPVLTLSKTCKWIDTGQKLFLLLFAYRQAVLS